MADEVAVCPRCHGDKRVEGERCPTCSGTGVVRVPDAPQESADVGSGDDHLDLTFRR